MSETPDLPAHPAPAALARLGNHLIVALDPDGGPALEREEARQADRQYLTMSHAAPKASSSSSATSSPAGTTCPTTAVNPLSRETTRRLGCDAWLVTAILNTDGDVLDIGRMSRIVPRPAHRLSGSGPTAAPPTRHEVQLPRTVQGTTVKGSIMSLSSCSTMWQ
jgi:hypothetical protein